MSVGGLDVGTTVCRFIVFDDGGKILTSAYSEYPLITSESRLEIDPRSLWRSVCDVCREAASQTRGDPIEAIAVAAMGDTLITADENFEPVANAILAFDTRSTHQCDKLIDRFGREQLYHVTGMPAHPMTTATKVLWVLDSAVERDGLPERFMCAEDFVIARLTGEAVASWSTAARTMMFDSSSRQWSGEILDYLGINREVLSRTVASATAVGTILRRVAGELGLSQDAVVVTGGHDQICSAMGSGAVDDGVVSDNTGTFECIIAGVGEGRRDTIDRLVLASSNLAFYPHGPTDLWAAFAWFNAGSVVNWCRDTLFAMDEERAKAGGEDIFEVMFGGLDDEPTKIQFLPHLTGTGTPWLDPVASGVLVGLDLTTGKYDLLKAAVHGIGYDLLLNLDGFERAGIHIEEIRTTGGGARSAKWVQLKADMTGRAVTVVGAAEASALGAAICAATAVGRFDSIREGAKRMVALGKMYEPDMERHKRYRAGAEQHRALYDAVLQYRGQSDYHRS